MRRFLRHIATNTFTNSAEYASKVAPFEAPEGFEWVEGTPSGLGRYQTQEDTSQTFLQDFLKVPLASRVKFYQFLSVGAFAKSIGDLEFIQEQIATASRLVDPNDPVEVEMLGRIMALYDVK